MLLKHFKNTYNDIKGLGSFQEKGQRDKDTGGGHLLIIEGVGLFESNG